MNTSETINPVSPLRNHSQRRRLQRKPAAKLLKSGVVGANSKLKTIPRFSVSVIYSEQPQKLNKTLSWEGGQLVKQSNGHLTKGTVETVKFNNLTEFKAFLKSVPQNAALTYGVTGRASATIVASKDHDGTDENTITRTRKHFHFSTKPGIMMLDFDFEDDNAMTPQELTASVIAAFPELAAAPMLWCASSSSGVIRPDGTTTGLTGHRIYIPVMNSSLILEAGKAMEKRLWAEGLGRIKISISGNPLRRCLIDTCVYRPEHLDFVAKPTLGPGLKREVPDPIIVGDPNAQFDLQRVIDANTPDVAKRAKTNYRKQFAKKQDEIQRIRAAWLEKQCKQYEQKTTMSREHVRLNLMKIFEDQTLPLFFSLITAEGEEITVSELWDDPKKYDKQRFHDPLEPDYRNDPRIAYLRMLDVKEPYIYSHAHGGCRYKLEAPRVVVEIVKGNVHQLKMQCMAVLSKSGDFFSYGSDKPVMAQVMKWGKLKVLDAMWMTDELDRRIEFRQVMGSGSSRKSVPADTPSGVSASLLTNFIKFKGFPPLEAVIQDPILRLDGSLLNTPGYDSQTKLYLVDRPGSSFSIPVNPSQEEAAAAVNVLWAPFAEFPWCGAVDRGVVFAAELTACLRPILLTAPGFGFDAPTAGTGKTLAAKAIGALATGVEPPVIPPVPPRDDETRKRLFALLMEAVRVILLDNLIDPLGNAALDSFLTAKFYSDRPLSTSKILKLPNRALFLTTGNNLRIVGDTYRRILVARMDSKQEHPDRRPFTFDPIEKVLASRQQLLVAALTIIRAWITAGRPRLGPGRTASFETWDDLVRQAVCWVAGWSMLPNGRPRFADPNKSLQRNLARDPETQQLIALLTAWEACFNTQPQPEVLQVKDLISFVSGHQEAPHASPVRQLHDALVDIAGEPNGAINPRRLGWWFEHQADRPIKGLRLRRRGTRQGAKCWVVVRTHDQPRGQP